MVASTGCVRTARTALLPIPSLTCSARATPGPSERVDRARPAARQEPHDLSRRDRGDDPAQIHEPKTARRAAARRSTNGVAMRNEVVVAWVSLALAGCGPQGREDGGGTGVGGRGGLSGSGGAPPAGHTTSLSGETAVSGSSSSDSSGSSGWGSSSTAETTDLGGVGGATVQGGTADAGGATLGGAAGSSTGSTGVGAESGSGGGVPGTGGALGSAQGAGGA